MRWEAFCFFLSRRRQWVNYTQKPLDEPSSSLDNDTDGILPANEIKPGRSRFMKRTILFAALALVLASAPARADGITGQYVEARTCDVWTGPCFANADFNLSGKNAVMAWRIDKGAVDNVSLDGLGVVAVISASDTLGLKQTGPASALLIVDERATPAQRKALVRLAKKQGGQLVANVVGVQTAPVSLTICECKGNACSELK